MSATKLLASAFRKVAAKLPALRTAHREFADTREGQLEASLSSFEQRLFECEQAGAAHSPQLGALREAMTQFAAAARIVKTQEVTALINQMLILLDGRELARAMREATEAEAEVPPVEPDGIGNVKLVLTGMTAAEVRLVMFGVAVGREIASPQGLREIRLPPELEVGELERAIEYQRARAGLH
jgi:hypothetical protein